MNTNLKIVTTCITLAIWGGQVQGMPQLPIATQENSAQQAKTSDSIKQILKQATALHYNIDPLLKAPFEQRYAYVQYLKHHYETLKNHNLSEPPYLWNATLDDQILINLVAMAVNDYKDTPKQLLEWCCERTNQPLEHYANKGELFYLLAKLQTSNESLLTIRIHHEFLLKAILQKNIDAVKYLKEIVEQDIEQCKTTNNIDAYNTKIYKFYQLPLYDHLQKHRNNPSFEDTDLTKRLRKMIRSYYVIEEFKNQSTEQDSFEHLISEFQQSAKEDDHTAYGLK